MEAADGHQVGSILQCLAGRRRGLKRLLMWLPGSREAGWGEQKRLGGWCYGACPPADGNWVGSVGLPWLPCWAWAPSGATAEALSGRQASEPLPLRLSGCSLEPADPVSRSLCVSLHAVLQSVEDVGPLPCFLSEKEELFPAVEFPLGTEQRQLGGWDKQAK